MSGRRDIAMGRRNSIQRGCAAGMNKDAIRKNHKGSKEKKSGEGESLGNGGVEEGSAFSQPISSSNFRPSNFPTLPVFVHFATQSPMLPAQHFAASHNILMFYSLLREGPLLFRSSAGVA